MRREAAILVMVIIGALGFLVGLLVHLSPGDVPPRSDGGLLAVPATGGARPLVVIEEFSDFQCPFCGKAALDSVKKVKEQYGDQVSIRFRHFPLRSHKEAVPAAKAAMAAGFQGKFWEMHDLLFQSRKELSTETYVDLARQLGLDADRLLWDMDDSRLDDYVQSDAALARALDIRGAPTFFINGKQIVGAQPPAAFSEIIDAEITAAEALLAEGVGADEIYRRRALVNGANEAFLEHLVDGKPMAPPAKKKSAQGTERAGDVIPAERWQVRIAAGDPTIGPANAPLTLVVFSDFQCPYSRKATVFLREVLERFGGAVRVVYKHNPLEFHQGAVPAAEASMAAHAQGRFWEMHDALFNNQDRLSPRDLEAHAAAIGLDMARFRGDMAAHRYKAAVDTDLDLVSRLGVQGTPNIFINGRLLRGAHELSEVEDVLQEELAEGLELRGKGIEDVHRHLTKGGKEFTPLGDEIHIFDVRDSPGKGGGLGAPVEIVLFSDFQCPYCSRINPALDEVVERSLGRARLIFKQFPLTFHQDARPAAAATLAAHAQGKFWEMHDLLFANQKSLTRADLEGFAGDLGLDMTAFKAALDSGYDAVIDGEIKEGQKAGVRGTPTFFINGRKYQGPGRSADDIAKVIDKLLLSK
ncbi:MAG: thioredoxin domain-containing protein [Pseudomonadota bacterium]